MTGMCLSPNSKIVEYEDVMLVATPDPTPTWQPIPHFEFVDQTLNAIQNAGFEIIQMHHALWREGIRYFGMATLKGPGDWAAMIGMRNCHDKQFSAWWGFGTRVWQCDNLQVSAELQVQKKRTPNVRDALRAMTVAAASQIQGRLEQEARRINAMQLTQLKTQEADHIIMEAYRSGVIGERLIGAVWRSYQMGDDGFSGSSAWDLYNAHTKHLSNAVLSRPNTTMALNTIIDHYTGVAV